MPQRTHTPRPGSRVDCIHLHLTSARLSLSGSRLMRGSCTHPIAAHPLEAKHRFGGEISRPRTTARSPLKCNSWISRVSPHSYRRPVRSYGTSKLEPETSLWKLQNGSLQFCLRIHLLLSCVGLAFGRASQTCGLKTVKARCFPFQNRDLFLFHGIVGDVLTSFSVIDWKYRSPNIWWPDDRAWCVVTEIDFTWSYIGGSSACIRGDTGGLGARGAADKPGAG